MTNRAKIIIAGFPLVVLAIVTAIVFDALVFPTASMAPTIGKSETVLVSRFSYFSETPKRGDIVTYTAEKYWTIRGDVYAKSGSNFFFIKRIVALPGETVAFSETGVTVNGSIEETRFLLPDPGLYHLNMDSFVFGNTTSGYTVPKDQYFLLGDNAKHSNDSRYNGPVGKDEIRGRAVAVIWPPDRWTLL